MLGGRRYKGRLVLILLGAASPAQSKMADLLGSILSSMERPPQVGDQESRRKAKEQAARLKKLQEHEKRQKVEFRKRVSVFNIVCPAPCRVTQ
uniref:Uncharacterized protein n=1 Tax=Xenopus tropicalis TaxID=8364 RepID=A0A1B8XSH7_XENTR